MKKEELDILIKKLQAGTINSDERRKLELEALHDDFLFEALEGYSTTENKTSDIQSIRKRIEARNDSATKQRFIPWLQLSGIAATMAGLLFVSWWFLQNNDMSKSLVSEKAKTETTFENTNDEEPNGAAYVEKNTEPFREKTPTQHVLDNNQSSSESKKQRPTSHDNRSMESEVAKKVEIIEMENDDLGEMVTMGDSEDEPAVIDLTEEKSILPEKRTSPTIENPSTTNYQEEFENNTEDQVVTQDANDMSKEAPAKDMTNGKMREADMASNMKGNESTKIDDSNDYYLLSGMVLDEDGIGLIGATIRIDELNINTITDFDGKFTLKIPVGEHLLIARYVGYETKESLISRNQENIIIALESGHYLDEVAVSKSIKSTSPIMGFKDLTKYIQDNKPEGSEGTVIELSFTVNKKGELKNIKVQDSNNPEFNETAIDIFKEAGLWKTFPANKRVQSTYTIRF